MGFQVRILMVELDFVGRYCATVQQDTTSRQAEKRLLLLLRRTWAHQITPGSGNSLLTEWSR